MSCKYTIVTALAVCALLVGCESDSQPLTSKSTNYEVGDDSPATSTPPAADSSTDITAVAPSNTTSPAPPRPAPMNQAAGNTPDVVQPTPNQLLGVIRQLRQQEPKGTSRDEVIANFIDLQMKLVQAVDMLMQLKPDDAALTEGASAKISALTEVSRLGAEGALDQLFAFTDELAQHPSEAVSTFGKQQSFIALLNAFSTGQVNDAEQVVEGFKKLAADQPKEGGLLSFGRDVASRFTEKGMMKEGAELLRHTAGLVLPTEDARLKASAESLIEEARFAESGFSEKFRAVAEKEEGSVEAFTKILTELTSGEQVGATTLQTLLQVASMLEGLHPEAASQVYGILDTASSKSDNEDLTAMVKDSIEKYHIRNSIVGKPFDISGTLLSGAPFDWSKYKGKVVLVDFWATWCGPCLEEMPNIRTNYDKYRDKGFEVVGINLDDDAETLEEFNKLQALPWPSVLSADPMATGWNHPMVEKNGVAAIPFLVLVDRDGTAIALNTRGEALGEKLAELFPEAAVPAETTPPETPTSPVSPAAKAPEPPTATTPSVAAAESDAAPVPPAEAAPASPATSE